MAIKKFTRNHKTAKKFLRATIKKADLRGKKKYFTQWKQDHEADKQDEGKDTQNLLVEEVQEKQFVKGNMQNKNLDLQHDILTREKKQISLCRKTLAKVIAQYGRYQ